MNISLNNIGEESIRTINLLRVKSQLSNELNQRIKESDKEESVLLKSIEQLKSEKAITDEEIGLLWENVKTFIAKLYESQLLNQKIQQEVTQKLIDKYSSMVADNYIKESKDAILNQNAVNNNYDYNTIEFSPPQRNSIEPKTEKTLNLILDTKSISSLSQSRRNVNNNLGMQRDFDNTCAYTNTMSNNPFSNDQGLISNFLTNNYISDKKSRSNLYNLKLDISNFPEKANRNTNNTINFNYADSDTNEHYKKY